MTLKNGFGKCSSFVLSASRWKDQNIASSFSRQKNPLIWRRSCSIGQSCCGMTSKRSIRSLYPFHKPIKSLASHPVSHRIKPKKFLTVYSLFVGGRLLTFSAFRMGACSRWALIRGWALIRINTVLVETFRCYWRRRRRRGRHFFNTKKCVHVNPRHFGGKTCQPSSFY